MKKIALVLNWVMLALFGVAFIILLTRFPGRGGISSLFPLLPWATALLAYKSAPSRGLAVVGIFFNGFIVVAAVLGLVASLMGRPAHPFVAGLVCLLLLVPAILNCILLNWSWNRARALSANKRMQATRETRSPDA
jgi:hypothetical protein